MNLYPGDRVTIGCASTVWMVTCVHGSTVDLIKPDGTLKRHAEPLRRLTVVPAPPEGFILALNAFLESYVDILTQHVLRPADESHDGTRVVYERPSGTDQLLVENIKLVSSGGTVYDLLASMSAHHARRTE